MTPPSMEPTECPNCGGPFRNSFTLRRHLLKCTAQQNANLSKLRERAIKDMFASFEAEFKKQLSNFENPAVPMENFAEVVDNMIGFIGDRLDDFGKASFGGMAQEDIIKENARQQQIKLENQRHRERLVHFVQHTMTKEYQEWIDTFEKVYKAKQEYDKLEHEFSSTNYPWSVPILKKAVKLYDEFAHLTKGYKEWDKQYVENVNAAIFTKPPLLPKSIIQNGIHCPWDSFVVRHSINTRGGNGQLGDVLWMPPPIWAWSRPEWREETSSFIRQQEKDIEHIEEVIGWTDEMHEDKRQEIKSNASIDDEEKEEQLEWLEDEIERLHNMQADVMFLTATKEKYK